MGKSIKYFNRPNHLTLLFLFLAVLSVSCAGDKKNPDKHGAKGSKSLAADTLYTQQAAMSIYAYQPLRALQIIDTAVVVGNINPVHADLYRARIYSMTQQYDQVDSLLGGPKDVRFDKARALGESLLGQDFVNTNPKNKLDVLEILIYTARQQGDTLRWLQRSKEYVEICHELGDEQETNALRTEAEIGSALHYLGQHEQGMAKLDSVINRLEASFNREDRRGAFNELDALIIALKRKIVLLGSHDKYAETVPLARRIIEKIDDYEQHPAAYHDSTYREPPTDQKRADYIRFYRSQAQNFITAAYVSLGEEGNMLKAFEKIEKGVREVTVREHEARYKALQQQVEAQRQQAKTYKARMIAVGIGILALFLFVVAIVFILRFRTISRKNRMLAHQITDAINYKKKYWELKEKQMPLPPPDLNTAPEDQCFQYINDIILREGLYLDPKFERQSIMSRFNLSKDRVGAIFSKGSSYAKLPVYIQQLRLDYAAKLLIEQPMRSVVQVASDCGFNSSAYFCSRFRLHFGLSPSDYRKDALSQK